MKKVLVLVLALGVLCLIGQYVKAQDEPPPPKRVNQPEVSPVDEENKRFNDEMGKIRAEETELQKKFVETAKAKYEEAKKAAGPDAKPADIKFDINAIIDQTLKDQLKALATKESEEEINHLKKLAELDNNQELKTKTIEKMMKDVTTSFTNNLRGMAYNKAGIYGRRGPRGAEKVEPFDKDFKYEELIDQNKLKDYVTKAIDHGAKANAKALENAQANKDADITNKVNQKTMSLTRMAENQMRPRAPRDRE